MSQPVPDHDQRNLLAGEASPYLRQHASNPVHWRPWSKAALDEARSTGKPILLSIGYAACHWCHVMAHESFEDPAVAEVMNRLFVNIKVDREERPDIDQIYMTALTAMGEQGGWPMTMFLTPDGEPFWGGTYFPRQARYGRPGFIDILNAVHDLFLNEKDRIALNVGAIRSHLASSLAGHADRAALSPAHADTVADRIAGMIDTSNGGIRGAPKFPNAPFIEALWLSWLRTGNEAHRDACLLTWRHMLDGGIYDHLGGGMARYSVDDRWLAPHFEKMLDDNAQMIRHALWAWHATGDHLFRMRIEETAGWLAREMLLPSGAFASSLDADSEGEEGRFYVWSADELRTALGSDYDLFASHYDVTREGNWEGHTIPNRLHAETPARDSPVEEKLARLRERLLLVRARRVRPGRDDKALTDWNGLAIRAMAEAGRTLQRSDWIALARNAYQAVVAAADDDRLPHSTMPGARSTTGLASDYAAMINAAVSLCEATLDPAYLDDARRLHGSLDRWHAMGADGYSQTATDRRDVILHIRGDQDDATPSATAQIIEALARLATITGDEALAARSIELAEYAVGRALDKTFGHVGIINAATIAADPWKLVVVEPGEGDRPLMAEAARSPDPRRCDLFVPLGASPVALPAGTVAETHRSAAWLCRGHTCLLPVTEAEKLAVMLADR